MLKKIKKGFTLVELVVVIAIIAILSGVSVAVYVGITNKAKVAADSEIVTQLNTQLRSKSALEGANKTCKEAYDDALEVGFDLAKLKPQAGGYYVWDQDNDLFAYLDKDSKTVFEDKTKGLTDIVEHVWKFTDTIDSLSKYSQYLTKEVNEAIKVSSGFDAGNVTSIPTVSYTNNNEGQSVVIRTNSGTLTVDAQKDTVNHYGKAGQVNIENIDTNSYHVFGDVSSLNVKNGHVVIESTATVSFLASSETATLTNNGKVETANVELIGAKKVDTVEVDELTDFAGDLNGYYVLKASINLAAMLEVKPGKNVVIDLNGFEITANAKISNKGDKALIAVHNGGQLTVNDSVGTGKIIALNSSAEYAAIQLTLPGAQIYGEPDNTKTAKLTINGGTVCGNYYGIVGNGNRDNTEIVINGGIIKGIVENDNTAIYHPQNGKLTINGGELIGDSAAIELRSGELTINGGEFVSTFSGATPTFIPNGSGTTSKGVAVAISQHTTGHPIKVNITGGTFNGIWSLAMADIQDNETGNVIVSITGGTFNGEVKNMADPDWILNIAK